MKPDGLRIALTPGEPGGIGPDLCVRLAQGGGVAERVVVADPDLLRARADCLGLPLVLRPFDPSAFPVPSPAGVLSCLPVPLAARGLPGQLDPANAASVLQSLTLACEGCLTGLFDALVTGPVHKSVFFEAGFSFSGHTEFLAAQCQADPVMMLMAPGLRVALLTTHVPLAAVPGLVTRERLRRVLRILDRDLRAHFAIEQPTILVCGLNPHAGENGHLGREEVEIIIPALDELRREGLNLIGPLSADSLFVPDQLDKGDAVLALYHDQGLPVLKHRGFGQAVNITLGLPIVRTSVDHGTALSLAGTGQADPGSLMAAERLAIELASYRRLDRGKAIK
ncbi:4-hydroxythreonine-4-phosphate dehydrogenase [Gammaproteobacteria bacterium]